VHKKKKTDENDVIKNSSFHDISSHSLDSKCPDSSFSSSLLTSKHPQTSLISNGNIRPPIKRRTISQIPVPPDQPIDHFLDTAIKRKFLSSIEVIKNNKQHPTNFDERFYDENVLSFISKC